MASEEDIRDFAEEVHEVIGDRVKEVYLFGSYARDEHVPGSDIDVLILLSEEEEGDEEEVWKIVDRFFRNRDLRFTPKIYPKSDFEDKVERGYSFYSEVTQEKILHCKAAT